MLILTDGEVAGGVDTHKDFHVAAVLDHLGRLLATALFPATPAGYRDLLDWMRSYGQVTVIGVEGTGTWGAGLVRFLALEGVAAVEVERPNRQHRRRRGKSDPTDAEAAARAVLAGHATATPKTQNGQVEAIRMLRIARRSAVKSRTQTANQLHALVVTAPASLRCRLQQLSLGQLVDTAARFRPGAPTTPEAAAKHTLRILARRYQQLDLEIGDLDRHLDELVRRHAPELLAHKGVGTEVAATLLIVAGDNSDRLHSEAAFAALCGVAPLPASSGNTQRHRLSRAGDRQANNALWRIVLVRLHCHQPTKDYMARRLAEGRTKAEIIRCLKRYVARELFKTIRQLAPSPTPT